MPPMLVHAIEYSLVILGSFFVAVAFNVFLLPHEVASGGVAGISTITKAVFGWEPSVVQWALNIPLFIAGIFLLGMSFGAKTLVGTVILPFFVFLTKDFPSVASEPLLGAIFGGMGVGLGLGIVFRGRASTGGIDLAAQIFHKFIPLPLSICVAIFDGMIVTTAAFVFSIEQGLYALIGLFVTSKTIDFVQVGMNTSKNVLIITKEVQEVRKALLQDVDRGVTVLQGTGGYTNEERQVMMCVVARGEFSKVTKLVRAIDSDAFVVVMNATEVLGEGFKTN
ncbi:YitT family protein [Radiobacillus deserti]|uniref:YitT family protein n=1 Tax=Radiobacillus deserti TaxID=2594883 RepID=A0A516KLE0_9BACI|nr:YitT family protein [Radiobacillus deserti]QDP42205.1 YitT family protein [Radiobacillus deserti]